jgi:alpha-D-ribose 1-methylphosphonate 5-triphosphate diphosphatase
MNQLIFSNARIVTPETNFMGSVVIEGNLITDVCPNKNFDSGIDLNGQWLIPGIIDIHSDYLEKELHPRPSADFPIPFAMHFMDARAASCGITSLFSAVSFTEEVSRGRTFKQAIELTDAINNVKDNLMVRHYIHARLDPNSAEVVKYLDDMLALENLKIIVYNENIPGQRQFSMDRVIDMRVKHFGYAREDAEQIVADEIITKSQINHRKDIQRVFEGKLPIGSHDDTTTKHVIEAKECGASLSEMPTTIEAARKAKELGMFVCMGAPNYFRGGSHCGNLACQETLDEGLVDILCSDYHFPTLLGSLTKMLNAGYEPSKAVNLMTKNPADYLNLPQLGRIEKGAIADLISFSVSDDFGMVSNVVVDGKHKYFSRY